MSAAQRRAEREAARRRLEHAAEKAEQSRREGDEWQRMVAEHCGRWPAGSFEISKLERRRLAEYESEQRQPNNTDRRAAGREARRDRAA